MNQTVTERQHRAQTNVAALCGKITQSPKIRFMVKDGQALATNQRTGKPLEVATMTVKVDRNGDDPMFVTVEAVGDLALSLAPLKRGQTVALSGRYEIHSRKVERDDQAFWYQNDTFKVVDRRYDRETGEVREGVPAPINLVPENTKNFFDVRFVGTVGKNGFREVIVGSSLKSLGSIACNGTKADRPSWFDTSAWNDLAREFLSVNASSLIEVFASPRYYSVETPWGTNAKKIDMKASKLRVIVAKDGPATAAASIAHASETAANDVLAMLAMNFGAKPEGAPVIASIDPLSDDQTSEHLGSEHVDAETLGAAQSLENGGTTDAVGDNVTTIGAARGRRRKGADSEGLAA